MNLINRSSTLDLYNLAEKLGIKDLIIISKNDFSKVKKKNRFVIMNLGNSTHWVAVDTKYHKYFDTYAISPPNIIKNYKQYTHNFQIQSLDSSMCGQLCLLAIKFWQDNIKDSEFYNLFKDVYPF